MHRVMTQNVMPLYVKVNEHVVSNVCTTCPDGTIRDAGDDASKSNTECEKCAEGYYGSNECILCPSGYTSAGGDDKLMEISHAINVRKIIMFLPACAKNAPPVRRMSQVMVIWY